MPESQEGSRAILFFILLLFILNTPDQTPRRRFHFGVDHYEDERRRDFDVLANTTYGDFTDGKHLNLTAFRESDGHHWELLPKVQQLSRDQFSSSWAGLDNVAFYDEITSEIRGDFKRSELSVLGPTAVNLTELDPMKEYVIHRWHRNITEAAGEIKLSLVDEEGPFTDARDLKADIEIWTESAPGDGWQTTLRGVHFPNGAAVLSTASSKFDAFPALPHFALDAASFDVAKPIMNTTVAQLWKKQFYRDVDVIGVPRCELIVWLQPKPLLGSKEYLRMVEKELSYPEGAPIGTPPPMSFSAVVFSPDCGYVLETDSLSGQKAEAFTKLESRLLIAFILTLTLQIALLKRQMKKAGTPSTRSRVAYQGVLLAALGDGLIFFIMIFVLMSEEAGFLVVFTATFLACIHVAFLEVKFVYDIWTVQVGEPQRAEAERQRRLRQQTTPPVPPPPPQNPTPPPQPIASDNPVSAVLPSTNTPTATPQPTDTGATPTPIPLFMPSDQDSLLPVTTPGAVPTPGNPLGLRIRDAPTTFASIYMRFYVTLCILLLLSGLAPSLPRPFQSIYFTTLSFAYFSIWLPQIYRNVQRNCRKALSWEYVLGSSVLRATPVLYWYVTPRNLFGVRASPRVALALAAWLALQVGVLLAHRLIGPRFGIPESWCEAAYEYHPVLVEGTDEEGGTSGGRKGLDIALLASASEAKDREGGERRCFDCAICMNEIDVPVVGKGNGAGGAARGGTLGLGMGLGMERASYMVTPCRHIFHAECLEGWMGLRLVCPVCREELPPL
ncbi:uncharacterized protein HMPREF1541_09863 [Cyphellophora europaea CBS 101466]|uniref:DSC E3 ubiquitin ligase complex subunit A n=1 Tax=Cyphellophora europaea (strain CBS 101466) TaxID=1220924 RepID=W2S8I9_CYPE1|nr:uncharacterized protein HMPREF1541_09863 [Cyphellophora europaea CBS 101466]ETN44987.1 hypothetical protein HMPREF1541_09863 [Cyphellophora europaea CBS 101466]